MAGHGRCSPIPGILAATRRRFLTPPIRAVVTAAAVEDSIPLAAEAAVCHPAVAAVEAMCPLVVVAVVVGLTSRA